MLGDRLRRLREERGYTQVELAELLDLGSQAQVWRWESGKQKPSSDAVVKLAIFFDVSSDFLLGLSTYRSRVCEDTLSPQEREFIGALRDCALDEAIYLFSVIVEKNSGKIANG